jgi:glutamate synthase domain-containing protein 3
MGRITLIENNIGDIDLSQVTMDHGGVFKINAKNLFYKELNKLIRYILLEEHPEKIEIYNVYGQRYIGTNLRQSVKVEIHGTPGNDLGAFMDGPIVEVFGNAQDGCGNTMNNGEIIVHGNAGDITGFSARGGEIYIRGSVGYRVGIHMKEFEGKKPTLVIGGTAQDFLGEYMAGGVLIILGLNLRENDRYIADFIGTGMHGGVIYVRGKLEDHQFGKEVGQLDIDDNDRAVIEKHVNKFSDYFDYKAEEILTGQFTKLLPLTHRPYGKLYAY